MTSILANAIYDILRSRVPNLRPEITYSDLVEQLGSMPPPNLELWSGDPRLNDALSELVTRCRRRGFPAISAIVVQEVSGIPGAGYYPVAHPAEADDPVTAMIAWGQEVQRVRITSYPPEL